MALPIYLEMDGIEGNVTRSGLEGMCEVLQFEYSVTKPTERDTGRATGDRVHGPIRVLKRIDKASPLIAQNLIQGSVIASVKLHFFEVKDDGSQAEYYTIALANALIVEYQPMMEHTLVGATRELPHQEWVSFRFEEITYTIADGNLEFTDAWTARG